MSDKIVSSTRLLRTIRKYCLECSAGQRNEVLHCPMDKCPLYEYRMGLEYQSKTEEEE
jgi:hypothetical protein